MNLKAKIEELEADARELRSMATPDKHFLACANLREAALFLQDAAHMLRQAVANGAS